MALKVILFNGSSRKEGNTYYCLKIVSDELEAEGIETELIWLGEQPILPCKACYNCKGKKKCIQEDDKLNEYIKKILQADGVIIGSPTYFADVSSTVKAFIDRAGLVSRMNGDLYKHKVGAAVIAVRRAGALHAFSSINFFFLVAQMIVVGSSYWNLGIGRKPGEVLNDQEGVDTFRTLGKNFSRVLKKLNS